ncbi:MAG TPA: hypothetical protein DEP13_11105 [Gammaproteobacteria bacterium]|nr:hypothetical protein [Gammaproteobacteria bacterium]
MSTSFTAMNTLGRALIHFHSIAAGITAAADVPEPASKHHIIWWHLQILYSHSVLVRFVYNPP